MEIPHRQKQAVRDNEIKSTFSVPPWLRGE
jgi:hypothetical protein